MANESEIRRWNDARWVSAWPQREQLTNSVTPDLRRAIGTDPMDRVLDIGCGGGGLAVELSRSVASSGEVVGVDVSTGLLLLARQRADAAGVGNLHFVEADLQAASVPGRPFDLAVSQFGVMFFDQPAVAFANIEQHLRPGGCLVFACWQAVSRNPWHIGTALVGLVPPPAPPGPGCSATGPFTLGDVEHVTALLSGAGFVDVSVEQHESSVVAPATAVVDTELLAFMGITAEHQVEAQSVIEQHLAQFEVGPDAYRYPLAFQVVTARRP